MSFTEAITLEGLTGTSGFIADGDWIESKDQDPTGSIRLIQLADIGDGVFLDRSRRFVNTATAKRLRCTLLQAGDVLIARMPDPLGRTCVFPDIGQPAITAVDVCILRADSAVADPDWVTAAINAPDTRSQIEKLAQGATRARVPTGQLRKLIFQVPHIDEQRRIAVHLKTQLAAVGEARNAVLALIGDAKRLGSAILEEAFAESSNAKFVKVSDVARTTSGTTPSRARKDYWEPPKHPWVKTGEVAFKPISQTEELISERALGECSLSLLPPGTVLIAMYGQGKTRGQSAVLEVAATTNQACFAILPNDHLDPEYLQFWLRHSYQALRAQSEARGGNQSNLNGAMLNNFEVPLLPRPRQQAIAKCIKVALAEAEILQHLLSKQLSDIEQMAPRLLSETFNKLDHQAAHHG